MKNAGQSRNTMPRSVTVSVRLDPKLRYLAELAAGHQSRTLSSFIDWAVKKALGFVEIGPDSKTISDYASFLWDTDESDRLVKLALNFEDLLNTEQQLIWKLIKENRFFWLFGAHASATSLKLGESKGGILDTLVLDKGVPDTKKIREYWPLLLKVARGQEPPSVLPSPDAPHAGSQTPSAAAPKAEKRQPRKD